PDFCRGTAVRGNVSVPRIRRAWRAHILFAELRRVVSERGQVCGQDTEGRKTCRSPSRAADKVRIGRQHENRQNARLHDSQLDFAARGRGDQMIRRRQFLIALGASALRTSTLALAQPQAPKIPHIGYLSQGSMASNGAFLNAFKDALRELGYVEGRNIAIDVTWAGKAAYEFPNLAATLVKTNPAAIVTTCVPSTKAAKSATQFIPVVMSVDGDPVASGLVASLARPGANVTGTSTLFEELIPKHLEFLKLAVPKVRHVAVLVNPDALISPYFLDKFGDSAHQIGVK